MATGARWRAQLGEHGQTLTWTLQDHPAAGGWPLEVIDLTGAQSVTVTVTRLFDRTQLQQGVATVVNAASGAISFVLAEETTQWPGYCEVEAAVAWPSGQVQVARRAYLLVTGRAPLTPATQPALDVGDNFVVQVTQWTPTGDRVEEIQLVGPDLVPIGTPVYLWDDPGDSTDALVAWPGDPNTLLDNQP